MAKEITLSLEGNRKNLISGAVRCQPVNLAVGTYQEGEVLARIDGIYGKLAGDAKTAAAIMPYNETLTEQQLRTVYVEGNFNQDGVIFEGVALDDIKEPLRDLGILLRPWGAAPDADV